MTPIAATKARMTQRSRQRARYGRWWVGTMKLSNEIPNPAPVTDGVPDVGTATVAAGTPERKEPCS
jgi:hypothetical protein